MCGPCPLSNVFYHGFIVFKDKQMSTITGLLGVWWNVINGFLCGLGGLGFELTPKGQPLLCWQEVLTSQSQYPTTVNASNPSILKTSVQ